MKYPESKVYSDGNHFIAIPRTTRPSKKQKIEVEKIDEKVEITVHEEKESVSETTDAVSEEATLVVEENAVVSSMEKLKTYTRKDMFDAFYQDSKGMTRGERKNYLRDNLLPYFEDEEYCENFITHHLNRKQRNLIVRRIRMVRKVNLQEWNYFCTFTYDDKLHTEESFIKRLKICFRNLCYRKGWKYIGVWERSPEKKRLHFHGIFYIPPNGMVGELFEKEDYNFNTHKRQTTTQNTYFNDRFGRSDFEEIYDKRSLGHAVAYIMKYLEKSGEKLVYSRGLPQYFISDIQEEDVICPIGIDDSKMLLFDNFTCIDNGKRIGKVSQATIAKMRKCNN